MNEEMISPSTVEAVATKIAECDYRVTISKYVTSKGSPWVITVGESRWYRRLIVKTTNEDGTAAQLTILPVDHDDEPITRATPQSGSTDITLEALVSDNYLSVKRALLPETVNA